MVGKEHIVKRGSVTRRVILPVIGIVLLLAFVIIIGLAIMGPAVGNVFSGIVSGFQEAPGSSGSNYRQSIPVQVPQRVIIREGRISLIVEDTRAAKESIEAIVNEMAEEGAFVVASEERGELENQVPTITMVIRVPSERFDEVMDRLAGLATRVSDRRETAQDVTEEYVDLQARLESMEAARERLREIMNEAESVEDLLKAEQQLAEREAEIESIKGRLEYLTRSAQLSKVEIALLPSVLGQPIAAAWQPGETARKAYSGLVRSLKWAADLLIYVGIVVLPWLVVIGAAVYGVRRVVKRHRASRVPGDRSSEREEVKPEAS